MAQWKRTRVNNCCNNYRSEKLTVELDGAFVYLVVGLIRELVVSLLQGLEERDSKHLRCVSDTLAEQNVTLNKQAVGGAAV